MPNHYSNVQDEIETLKTKGNSTTLFCLQSALHFVYTAATTTGGEDVIGLKATIAELQDQLSTSDKIKGVCTI